MKQEGFRTYSLAKGGFSVEVPSDWTVIESRSEDVPGAQFLAPPPEGKRAVRHYISVDFFPRGNKVYSSPAEYEDYVASHDCPSAETARKAAPLDVGGVQARELRWCKPLPQSPEYAPEGRLAMRTVLLETGGGFYAINDAGPEDEGGAYAGVFRRVLETFKAGKPS
ncbi:MAG: hypothetical protein ABII00_02590 [Elusimicrobiota bacterium]